MRKSVIALGVAVLLASSISAAPAFASPVTLHCGDTLSVNTQMAHNLTCTSGVGLNLMSGVTLDLHGHTLSGGSVPSSSTGLVFSDDGVVTVKNGTVKNWSVAVDPGDGPDSTARFTGVTFTHDGSVASGQGTSYVLSHTHLLTNGGGIGGLETSVTASDSSFVNSGVAVSGFIEGAISITRSIFVGNTVAVQCSEGGMAISRSTFYKNNTAVSGDTCGGAQSGNNFVDNVTAYRLDSEFVNSTSFDYAFHANRFAGNTTAVSLVGLSISSVRDQFLRNGTAFVEVSGGSQPGTHVALSHDYFRLNGDAVNVDSLAAIGHTVAIKNKHYGIYAPLATDLGGNVARGNGYSPQCTGVVCSTS